jgi:hypothetical protein
VSTRYSDVALLLPAYRERLDGALKSLRGQGFKPVVHETKRSRERAQEMVDKGLSKARGGLSMHCYLLASDVICGDHGWQCARHGCKFFETYGACVEDAGLVWGGNWDEDERAGEKGEHDLPHNQAIPIRLQNKVRAMAPELLNDFLLAYYAGLTRA